VGYTARIGGLFMITVLIPAHNEAAGLGATLDSLNAQTVLPHRVVVICDNCTDDTEAVAAAHGAAAIRTRGNKDKKAGALNQAFTALEDLGKENPGGYVLVMDADTQLAPAFIETAARRLDADLRLGAVGAVFRGGQATSLLELCQSNEYARYARTCLTPDTTKAPPWQGLRDGLGASGALGLGNQNQDQQARRRHCEQELHDKEPQTYFGSRQAETQQEACHDESRGGDGCALAA
jgi:glycosyltransferase involved in cell wall biosynthesis